MKIIVDWKEVFDLLHENEWVQSLMSVRQYLRYEFDGEIAEEIAEKLINAYSGNGCLMIPLDKEAKDYIAKCENDWAL